MWALNHKGCGIIHAIEHVESSLLVADQMFVISVKNLAKQTGKFLIEMYSLSGGGTFVFVSECHC